MFTRLHPSRIGNAIGSVLFRRSSGALLERSTPTCLPQFEQALADADAEVQLALDEIEAESDDLLWKEGLQSLKRIAGAPGRHMLSSQLLLLSHVHDVDLQDLNAEVADDVVTATTSLELLHLFMLVQVSRFRLVIPLTG